MVIGFVYIIFRSCSSWVAVHEGLNDAREILNKNQYPDSFVEDLIKSTLYKLLGENDEPDVDNISDLSLDANACLYQIPEKDKFKFFITYRGKPTEELSKAFKKLNAPCRVIMTLRKMKTIMPSLKPRIPHMLQSNVVYQITCPGCNSS